MMRATYLTAALQELSNWLRLGTRWLRLDARRSSSPARPTAMDPLSKPFPAASDDMGTNPEHPQAGNIPCGNPDHDEERSDKQLGSGHIEDEKGSIESCATPAEAWLGPTLSEPGSPGSNQIYAERLPSTSTEVDSEGPGATTLSADNDQEHYSSEIDGHPECDDLGKDMGDDYANAGESPKSVCEPANIGGRRSREPPSPTAGKKPPTPPSSRPELICKRALGSTTWEILLSADEECQLADVQLDGALVGYTAQVCHLPSFTGNLTVSFQVGQPHDIALFESDPLIFKMRNGWSGEGRRVARVTTGFFIVIAPNTWQRVGRGPVEPENCSDAEFRAHYFYRDVNATDEEFDGFREWSGSPIAIGIKLTGCHIYDDADDGDLFVGDAPTLKTSPEIEWVRVGEEVEQGWGQNFQPDRKVLSEVMDGKEGRFFLRIYDSEKLIDSVAFRHLRDLKRIDVDGAEYTQDTVLVPGKTGYARTEVCFVDTNGSMLIPKLPVQTHQTIASTGVVAVPPHPDADRISCSLESGAGAVNITLDLPRIWWRLEDSWSDPGEWRDTPLVMTRNEFRNHADADGTISILSKRQASVRVGFDDEPGQPYRRTIENDRIAVPLAHFVDYAQIDKRLNDEAHFNIEWGGQAIPLIVISADPMPEIVSFTAEPTTILAGQEAILEWTTQNAANTLVSIAPNVGVVESDGICAVRPAETTKYTLTLAFPGADDIGKTITVAINSPPGRGVSPAPRVMSPGGRWRIGKGYSIGELKGAGLTVRDAQDRSLPLDRRRRSSHRTNVEAIRRVLDV